MITGLVCQNSLGRPVERAYSTLVLPIEADAILGKRRRGYTDAAGRAARELDDDVA